MTIATTSNTAIDARGNDMEIIVNGERRPYPADMTVAALLATTGHAGQRVAVIRNGEVVPRGQHAATALTDGDRIDIVGAVAGG